MMMNGDLMAQAVGGKPGSFLGDLLADAHAQSRTSPGALHGQQHLPRRPEPVCPARAS